MVKRSFVAFMAVAFIGWFAVSTSIAQTPAAETNPAQPSATAKKPATLKLTDAAPQEKSAKDKKAEQTLAASNETTDAKAAAAATRPMSADFLPVSTKAWLSIPNADDLDKRF